jgi:chromate reductase
MTYRVGVIVGSIAKESINRRFAESIMALGSDSIEFVDIDISALPLYSYDYDADYPEVAKKFKEQLDGVDAFFYVTPEYNRSVPGVLKNAIDWGSRPWGQGSLGKPSTVGGISVGPVGAAVAQNHLRQILSFFNAPLYSQPELYIHQTDELYTGDRTFNPGTEKFLRGWLAGFEAFLAKQLG